MSSLQHLHQPTNRCIAYQDQHYLFFGGTAYLGLLANQEYTQLFKEGIDKYGINNGTSRSNNVQLGIYEDAEKYLAKRFVFEDAAIFSSGYLAAQTTVRTLTVGKRVFYAPDCHQALWLENQPAVNGSFDLWSSLIVGEINAAPENDLVIIANALDNLSPAYYDFSFVTQIDNSKHITLILDDSHGIGVVRFNGISVDISSLNHHANIEVVVLASLAKGLGTDAGVVLGSLECVMKIKSSPIFRGASPCSPASLYAMLKGEDIYAQEYDKLQNNLIKFGKLVKDLEMFSSIPKFPVFTSRDVRLFDILYSKRLLISSFPYPLPMSPLLNRVVISSLHKEDDLIYLADVCAINKS